MALGADRGGVLAMVLRQGMGLAAGGLVVGMIAALLSGRLASGFLFGVEPHDPATVMVSVAACLVPARKATAVDPVTVLKTE